MLQFILIFVFYSYFYYNCDHGNYKILVFLIWKRENKLVIPGNKRDIWFLVKWTNSWAYPRSMKSIAERFLPQQYHLWLHKNVVIHWQNIAMQSCPSTSSVTSTHIICSNWMSGRRPMDGQKSGRSTGIEPEQPIYLVDTDRLQNRQLSQIREYKSCAIVTIVTIFDSSFQRAMPKKPKQCDCCGRDGGRRNWTRLPEGDR